MTFDPHGPGDPLGGADPLSDPLFEKKLEQASPGALAAAEQEASNNPVVRRRIQQERFNRGKIEDSLDDELGCSFDDGFELQSDDRHGPESGPLDQLYEEVPDTNENSSVDVSQECLEAVKQTLGTSAEETSEQTNQSSLSIDFDLPDFNECDRCESSFYVTEEKVNGNQMKYECRKCGGTWII